MEVFRDEEILGEEFPEPREAVKFVQLGLLQ